MSRAKIVEIRWEVLAGVDPQRLAQLEHFDAEALEAIRQALEEAFLDGMRKEWRHVLALAGPPTWPPS